MAALTKEIADQLIAEQGLDVVIPNIYTSIASGAFDRYDYDEKLLSVIIPDSVTSIGERAFSANKLTSVDIPDSVTSIGDGAFSANKLTSVDIPDSVTSIGDGAFSVNKLKSVDIPDSVTSIGSSAFSVNKLTSVDIPDSVTSIGDDAFSANKLTSVDIPDSVTSIGDDAFYNNELSSVYIGDGVTSIGRFAFFLNKLTSVDIPNSVTLIGDNAFSVNELTSFYIGSSVTSIGDGALSGNKLTSVDIPDSVTSIGDLAFRDNQLTSVDIGDGVTSIGNRAFRRNQLTSVIIPDSVTSIGRSAFHDNPLETVSIAADATFPITVFPEDVLIDYRGVDQSPTDISSSSSSFDENLERGSAVATLSTTDPDADDTHTYSLVSGDGDTDNSSFTIDGDQLKIVNSPDFEAQPSYAIRVQTKDSGDLTFEKEFNLTVNDLDETPNPPLEDLDGDGFVDGVTHYQMWTESGGVDLVNKRGRKFSDQTSGKWDAIKAVQTDSGFAILITHEWKPYKYKAWTADSEGMVDSQTKWKTGNQMMRDGYEDLFDEDINEDDIIGKPPVQDLDGDGFVDGMVLYQVYTGDDRELFLRSKDGKEIYSDDTSKKWNAMITRMSYKGEELSTIKTLIEGRRGKAGGKYKVWSSDKESGRLVSSTRFELGDWMAREGYEDLFQYDINRDGVIEIG